MSKQIPKGGLAFENSWTVPTMKRKQNKTKNQAWRLFKQLLCCDATNKQP